METRKSTHVDQRRTLAERLSPIVRALASPSDGSTGLEAAREELRLVADALDEAKMDDLSAAAAMLSDLAEIAGCSVAELDGQENVRLVGCIEQGVSLLRDALQDPEASSEELSLFLETARRDWSDCLAVVDHGEAGDLSAAVPDDDLEWVADVDSEAEAAPSLAEVQMILSTLGSDSTSTGHAGADDVAPARDGRVSRERAADDRMNAVTTNLASNLFDRKVRGAGEVVPPPALTTFDDVVLEAELLDAYLYDATQCLAAMEQAALEFESGGCEAAVQQLCRQLHTLKGASASVGLTNLGGYLHEVEEWLEQVGAPDNLDAVLSCIDVIRERVAAQQQTSDRAGRRMEDGGWRMEDGRREAGFSEPPSSILHSPSSSVAPRHVAAGSPGLTESGSLLTESGSADAENSLRVKASQVDRLMDLLADLVMLRSRRDRHVSQADAIHEELLGCLARLQSVAHEFPRSHAFTQSTETARRAGGVSPPLEQRVAEAVDDAPHDHHLLREGQLSEIAGDLSEVARGLKELRDPIADENRTISQFIRQFRHELMELRRMPVAGLFRRLQRAVRDAAKVENKQVRLQMVGEHAGLERSLQERLYEPLLHLVRNAVSHGIEPESDRLAAGKEAVGTITLEALGGAQLLVLEIRDDGRGLDYEAIRRRGIERGLLSPDQQTSPGQLAQLIFHPGFSTREQANAVAGRGVGMDVVASALRRMHARVDVESQPGRGTTMRLRIPLRSVIEHTMVFRCGGQLFALPVQSVRAATADERRAGPDEAGAGGDLLRLGDVLDLPRQADAQGGHCLLLGARCGLTESGSVVAQAIAVQVDEILGPDEVVVRSLPPLLRRHPLLAGATLSGGGDVVQLLDVDRLVEACQAALQQSASAAIEPDSVSPGAVSPGAVSPGADEHPSRGVHRVLVVDDSLSARRSLIQKLRPHGFELHEAGDGFEALDRLRAEHFDLVFSDLEMPRMGGFDLLAEIRSNRKTRTLPVVITTTRSEPEFRERAAELGTDGYLVKPVSSPDLEQILEQLASPAIQNNPGQGTDE